MCWARFLWLVCAGASSPGLDRAVFDEEFFLNAWEQRPFHRSLRRMADGIDFGAFCSWQRLRTHAARDGAGMLMKQTGHLPLRLAEGGGTAWEDAWANGYSIFWGFIETFGPNVCHPTDAGESSMASSHSSPLALVREAEQITGQRAWINA